MRGPKHLHGEVLTVCKIVVMFMQKRVCGSWPCYMLHKLEMKRECIGFNVMRR